MYREFVLTEEIKELGFSRVYVLGKNLVVYNSSSTPVQCKHDKNNPYSTIDNLKKALTKCRQFTGIVIDKFIALFSDVLLDAALKDAEAEASNENKNKDEAESEENRTLKAEIEKLKADNSSITCEDWSLKLREKYDALHAAVDSNLPKLWPPFELALSIKTILNINNCTLPFAAILLGPPSSLKTVVIEAFRKWLQTFYTDNFSARAFVSHNSGVSKEELEKIDMLPRLKNKFFLTPELAPTFAAKDDELIQVLGIMTRILDGHGYESDTGAQGHRGYSEDIMFTWLGAAVDIPHKVHKHLSTLGPKLYFFRLFNTKEDENYYYDQRNDDFRKKIEAIRSCLFEYLKWFEICPQMTTENSLPKISWNHAQDEELPHRYIIKLAFLLARLRAVVPTWETAGTQGSEYAYQMAIIEDPSRAINQLRSLAKGHALSQGRNYITIEDIYIVVHTVLSTASIERETIFELLIAHEGSLTTSQITESLNVAKPTALRTMTELKAIGLVDVNVNDSYNAEKRIILKDEFGWFLTPEFQTCKEKYPPRGRNNFEHPYEGGKFLYRCQYCDYKTYFQTEYDRHTVFKHPRKAGYNKRLIFDIKYLGHLTAQDCFKIFPGEMFENVPIEELNII